MWMMRSVRAWFLIQLILFSFPTTGQIRCGMMGSVNPDFEAYIKEARAQLGTMRIAAELELPVKVHILLDTPQVLSDEQVFSQIEVLNQDYSDHFIFSVKDVTRTSTSKIFGFNSLEDIMEIVPEDLEVLNIWVVDLQSGFLGAASFPWSEAVGGLDSISIMAATFPLGIQGLAIDYRAFGAGQEYDLDERFNEGKTATHELGHFLGLHHPWGLLQDCINDDFCDDTPEQSDFYFRCPGPTESSCSPGEILDLSNFMQFLDDECMDHFTTCQLERMKIVTQTNMTHLLNSPALDLPDYQIVTGIPEFNNANVTIYPNPVTNGRFLVDPPGMPTFIYDLSGKLIFEGVSGEIELDPKGLFILKVVYQGRVETFKILSD